MSKIRGKDTKPELLLKKNLSRERYKYKVDYRFKELNFKPDMVFPRKKLCIFIDGCFWHKCPKCFNAPKSNKGYWGPKIKRNVQRDRQQDKFLKKEGWKVLRFWEHEIKRNLEKCLLKIRKNLKG